MVAVGADARVAVEVLVGSGGAGRLGVGGQTRGGGLERSDCDPIWHRPYCTKQRCLQSMALAQGWKS